MPPARIVLWVASVGAIAVLVRTLLLEPLPAGVAFALLGAYLALGVLGIALPRLEMYGDAVWRGRPGTRSIALTFDDGPHPQTTRTILEILARGGHRATFFVVGSKVALFPDVVREIAEAGHTLGVHGYVHSWFYAFFRPRAVVADLQRACDEVERCCGVRPRLFRPPIGIVSPRVAAGAERAKLPIVLWTVKAGDGVATPSGRVLQRVLPALRDGAIVLLHDAAESGGHEPAAIMALPRILERIDELGLRTVSVADFVA